MMLYPRPEFSSHLVTLEFSNIKTDNKEPVNIKPVPFPNRFTNKSEIRCMLLTE
jgi:hypothetical protein